MKLKTAYADLILVFVFSIVYLVYAIYNHYAFFTSDTGAYYNNMFNHDVPYDRPRFYSDFMNLFFIHQSFWPIIYVQTALTIFLTLRLVHKLGVFSFGQKSMLLFIIFGFTQVSWFTAQLSPDFSSAVMILIIILLFIETVQWQQILLTLLLLTMTILHNSNFSTLFLLGVISLIASFASKSWIKYKQKSYTLIAVAVLSWFIIAYSQYTYSGRFDAAPAKYAFGLAKLQSDGILQNYLSDHCSDQPSELCKYKDEIKNMNANDFLWSSGIIDSIGGQVNCQSVAKPIIATIYSNPKYLRQIVCTSLKSFLKLLFSMNVGDGIWPYLDGSNMYWKAREHMSQQKFDIYLNSKQNLNFWGSKFPIFNSIYLIFFILVLAIAIFIKFWQKQNSYFIISLVIVTAYWLINDFICVNMTIPADRLNSRLIWLLTLIMTIGIVKKIMSNSQRQNNNERI